jgi:hypothetical protein
MNLTYSYGDMQEAKQSMYLVEASITEVEVTIDVLDELHGEPTKDDTLNNDQGTTWYPTGKCGRTIKGNRPTAEYIEAVPLGATARLFHWDVALGSILEWVVGPNPQQ